MVVVVVVVVVVVMVVVVVVVVVRTRCMTIMFIHGSQRMHLIEVAELPSSPPPRALDEEELFVIEG